MSPFPFSVLHEMPVENLFCDVLQCLCVLCGFNPRNLSMNLPLYFIHFLIRSDSRVLSLYKCFVNPLAIKLFSFSGKLIGFFKPTIGCLLIRLPFWLGKRCDSKQKWYHSWINCTNDSHSDHKDHQWFQNECNMKNHD